MKKFDIIVIGTGAGNIVVEEATKKGLSIAQIEKGKFGGTCLTRGCIPTKIMVTAGEELRKIREGNKIGINTENVTVDWEKISKRVWKKIDESKALRKFYLRQENVTVYEGVGYFESNKVVAIKMKDENGNDFVEKITADKIFLNVGGRTNVVEFEGLSDVDYLTSETFFGEKYPKNPYDELIIIGGGPIGTEFASTFSAMGSKVKLVQRNVRLLPKEEKEISSLVKKYLEKDGVEVYLNKLSKSIREENGKKILTVFDKDTGEETQIIGDEILFASGIRPNSDLLHLENTDIETDEKGWIKTNEFLETSVDGIWAIGDINGKQQFRHKANYEADIVSYNLFKSEGKDDLRWAEYNLVPSVTFCYPEVAHIGITEEEAIERGHNVAVGINRYCMTAKGYALGLEEEDELDAFAKLIIDRDTRDVLGMHVIGPFASTLIQPYLLLMNLGKHTISPINDEIASEQTKEVRSEKLTRKIRPKKLDSIIETMIPHPTLSEVSGWTYYNLEDKE